MTNKAFTEAKKEHLKTLTQYVPVVARVHGQSHNEFYDVEKEFNSMAAKLKAAGKKMPELDGEFAALRKITDNYTVPSDVCESYAAVYEMLSKLDGAYHAQE